ncbi:glutamate N-acetyltransferase [Singulisphaera sp. GP187]|uniref:bifunctional glutamate N-acetyltransferase/amino-acid acetyltransferase ArgJ n=1 Tax=Singulisphaera sp. GP187 TaxID=1882752 RepID=UPI000927E894|nr:bifunctional glutamate N-acetyltransferase/amino-acid acetyltransferase ArgJ [Singulisphaera sp. GP187]SIO60967.1 glutamate N-acetyltransferase [Singulisphaera sp. GP187]
MSSASESESKLEVPAGFRASAVKAGIKPSGGLDLTVIASDRPCAAAGTFTTNRVCAAPVRWDQALVPSDAIRAIVINAGNANAATGAQGEANAAATAAFTAEQLACLPQHVLVASTGVIGHQLPMDNLRDGLARALPHLSGDQERFAEAAQAIMTTDTHPKIVSLRQELDGRSTALLGLAKGAAMIGPRMATMLAFLVTDAHVAPADLQAILSEAVEASFNCISVEGHTSTNDTVLLLANGAAGGEPLQGDSLAQFAASIHSTCQTLARMIPEDGEGATHLITIDVEGARDREEARTIARAVADSPLVKTAVAGADPNWGRIVSAAGYSGVPFDERELSLWLNDTPLYRDGVPLDFDAAAVSTHLRAERETKIRLTLKRGSGSIRFWTCDLTAEYVRLNADYTT